MPRGVRCSRIKCGWWGFLPIQGYQALHFGGNRPYTVEGLMAATVPNSFQSLPRHGVGYENLPRIKSILWYVVYADSGLRSSWKNPPVCYFSPLGRYNKMPSVG